MKSGKKTTWLLGAATAVLGLFGASTAHAQQADEPVARNPVSSEDIVVPGEITYRNRVEGAAPVLEYGSEYFQRFEPLTVGDALKRVPSVAFLSDVLESDGVRLRGLDPAYTQILINGEQVPGSGDSSGAFGNGADGAFFVDRIPAELIERVEIVRSQSANRSGDALAGAINIVLRDAYTLDGGYVRAGVQYWENDENWGETLGGVWGGQVGPGRLLIGANMQDRHNPKDKLSLRYGSPSDATINETEVQTDVRDGTDYSANFSYETPAPGGEFEISGFYVKTDRYQNEDSLGYDGSVGSTPDLYINDNDLDIDQESYSLNAGYSFGVVGGETRIKLGFAQFTNSAFEFENEANFDDDEFSVENTYTDLDDQELKFKLEHERDLGPVDLEFGVHYERKERDNSVRVFEDDDGLGGLVLPNASLQAAINAGLSLNPTEDPDKRGDNTIERERIDPYMMVSGDVGSIEWEAGLRYETTEVTVTNRVAPVGDTNNSYQTLLPSAHIKWNVTEADRVLFSVARTTRNPSFSFLAPTRLDEELEDNDFQGDPNLKPETAWGVDLGFEHRIGRTGVAGVNVFYRDVADVIEVFNTGLDAEGPPDDPTPDVFIYSPRNTGDGRVYGVEFDLSTSLGFVGLENTGVFLNYSWLDSEIDDELSPILGSRAFNSQADSVFNIGFIQDLPNLGASFGMTYRDQGDAFSRVVTEEVETAYGADLEFFVEKRIGERFTVRLTGSNLLDESKDEIFHKFDNEEDQTDTPRNYDEYELETESAGPVFQLVGRYAF